MKFVERKKMELSDVLVPDLFISNYMAGLGGKSLKLYLYVKFLSKNGIEVSESEVMKKLGINKGEYESALEELAGEDLLLRTEQGFDILDIKEQELNKTFIPKLTPKLDKAKTVVEQKRIAAASAINDSFFQGIMTLGWYVDISTLFEKYVFDEDVMIALFHNCSERNALKKNYVFKVAESWYKGGVKTFEQLESYLEDQDKVNKIKLKIKKALGISNRGLNEYEEEHINRWINEYKYDFDIIEVALRKAVAKMGNPGLGYIGGILKNWHEKGYTTVEQVMGENTKVIKQNAARRNNDNKNDSKNKIVRHRNQTEFDIENIEKYYYNGK